MILPAFLVSLLFSIVLCVHVVRTHQEMFWLWIILLFQPLGGLVYLVAVVLPQTFGPTALRVSRQARETLDPQRGYRQARAACEDSPTVHNRMRLAAAAAELGRHAEAEQLYRESLHGVHAQDPALLLGRAKALLELGRADEALATLQSMTEEDQRAPQATLAFARAYQGLGRTAEADRAYRDAAERVPGFEAMARYAAFLGEIGRRREAADLVAEIDRRIARVRGPFRREAQNWRALAIGRAS